MQQFVTDIVDLKDWAVETTGLDRDAMHIYVALLIQFIVALPLRRRVASFLPVLVVICAILLNEWADLQLLPPDRPYAKANIDAAIQDLFNSILLPIILCLLARYCPGLLLGGVQSEAVTQAKEE